MLPFNVSTTQSLVHTLTLYVARSFVIDSWVGGEGGGEDAGGALLVLSYRVRAGKKSTSDKNKGHRYLWYLKPRASM